MNNLEVPSLRDVETFVVEAYENGYSSRLVARKASVEYGTTITKDRVLTILRKNGVTLRSPTKGNGTKRHLRKDGYVDVFIGVHHRRSKGRNGYTREHLLVIEEALGRPLAADEQVHHRNLCRSDNGIENLMCVTKTTHTAIHKILRVLDDDFATAYRRVTGESVEGSSFSLLCELKHRIFIDPYIARIEAGQVDAVIAEIRQLHEQTVEEVT